MKLPKAKCRSCGAPILWARMEGSGKAIPLDESPAKDGNLWASQKPGPKGIELTARAAPKPGSEKSPVDAERRRWRSHFASCPNASQHRGRS